MSTSSSEVRLVTIIKAKHIDEKGQLKRDSYYWILPDELSAKVGDLAFVETEFGPQIVHIIDVRKWGNKRIDWYIHAVATYRKKAPKPMQKVIAIQPKPKN